MSGDGEARSKNGAVLNGPRPCGSGPAPAHVLFNGRTWHKPLVVLRHQALALLSIDGPSETRVFRLLSPRRAGRADGRQEANSGLVADGPVRPILVVVLAPFTDRNCTGQTPGPETTQKLEEAQLECRRNLAVHRFEFGKGLVDRCPSRRCMLSTKLSTLACSSEAHRSGVSAGQSCRVGRTQES
jgi:hypothetical protein